MTYFDIGWLLWSDDIRKLQSSGNSGCKVAYFEAVGYYGRMVYGSYDQVAIQAAK